ncbi:MAG: NAD(P)/FAD-dependent oxidoreductase [Alphaproteobacteria bacterium]
MNFDYIVIGGGIAGASCGYFLAPHGRVLLIERESQPGYHSTGRSAALYTENYGNRIIQGLTIASRAFFERPPAGFADHPLLSPRGVVGIARPDQLPALALMLKTGQALVPSISEISVDRACAMQPLLRRDYVAGAIYEPEAMDMDVHALHQGYLKGLRAAGGRIATDAEVRGLDRRGGVWQVATRAGDFAAPVVVNAAGAWCDEIARLAGLRPVGLTPKRRTALIFAPPCPVDPAWPMMHDADETFYFKPDAGQMLGSPADETPMAPQDVQPDEIDIATCVDRIEQSVTFKIGRIGRRWAGLRSFVADKTPVVGFAPDGDGFLWLAGQGGYGIMTSPGMGEVAASLARGRSVPSRVADMGVTAAELSPARLVT